MTVLPNSSSTQTRTLLLGLWSHLNHRRRVQFGFLFLVMLASGAAELVSLGSVLPFLAVLSNPEKLFQQPNFQAIISQLGLTKASQLVLPIIVLFAFAVMLSAVVRILNLWLNVRFSAAVGSDLSCEAYRRTLYQPYLVHVNRNSSLVITAITTQIALTVSALNALLGLITSSIVSASLFIGLLLIDAQVAILSAILLASIYWALAISSRRELRMNGQNITIAANQQLKALQEGLGAIRDVLLDGTQMTYLKIYRKSDRTQRQLQANNVFLASFPRFALEGLGMVAIALLGGILVWQRANGVTVIPLLGALALGAQRLLPALQQIYNSWATIKGYNAAISNILDMLGQKIPNQLGEVVSLNFNHEIHLNNVSFRYDSGLPNVISDVDLKICSGERVGLIGSTGSGKSTLVDLLMGLLDPTIGRLIVDGHDMHAPKDPKLLASWRATIAHVPQNIFLADSSIAENIAFGVPYEKIDYLRVQAAAEKAQIASFIEESKDGYNTFVGERGIRLSGGQRQRIGIARALYKNARVLVLDEATSALDNKTENAIMAVVEDLCREQLTIVMIAHRLSTVECCDRVIRLSEGRVIADGSPSDVLKNF